MKKIACIILRIGRSHRTIGAMTEETNILPLPPGVFSATDLQTMIIAEEIEQMSNREEDFQQFPWWTLCCQQTIGKSIYAGLGAPQRNASTVTCCMVKHLDALGYGTARALRAELVKRKLVNIKAVPLGCYASLLSRSCAVWRANRAVHEAHMMRRRDPRDGVLGLCANDRECDKNAGVMHNKSYQDAAEKGRGEYVE